MALFQKDLTLRSGVPARSNYHDKRSGLAGLFTSKTHESEQDAYQKQFVGNVGVHGVAAFQVPNSKVFIHEGRELYSDDGTFKVINGAYFNDQAAMHADRVKLCRKMYDTTFWGDDAVNSVFGAEFLKCLPATKGYGAMPQALVAVDAQPSVASFYPAESQQASLAWAKSLYLLLHHPAAARLIWEEGKPEAPSAVDKPRAADSALKHAIA